MKDEAYWVECGGPRMKDEAIQMKKEVMAELGASEEEFERASKYTREHYRPGIVKQFFNFILGRG